MTNDLTKTQIFTIGQVAKLCDVAPRTAHRWFDAGRLKGYRLPGSMDRRTTRDFLIQFLKDNGLNTALEKLTTSSDNDPLQIARNATNLLQEQGGEKYIRLLAGMMRTCCTRCGAFNTCEFAFDAYNVDCEPKIDCLAAK